MYALHDKPYVVNIKNNLLVKKRKKEIAKIEICKRKKKRLFYGDFFVCWMKCYGAF